MWVLFVLAIIGGAAVVRYTGEQVWRWFFPKHMSEKDAADFWKAQYEGVYEQCRRENQSRAAVAKELHDAQEQLARYTAVAESAATMGRDSLVTAIRKAAGV